MKKYYTCLASTLPEFMGEIKLLQSRSVEIHFVPVTAVDPHWFTFGVEIINPVQNDKKTFASFERWLQDKALETSVIPSKCTEYTFY